MVVVVVSVITSPRFVYFIVVYVWHHREIANPSKLEARLFPFPLTDGPPDRRADS